MNRIYYLYALFDPNLNIPKYIGITCDPKRRFRKHIEDKTITKKTKWIQSLISGGKMPVMKLLKKTEDVHKVIDWEIKAISLLKDKYKLTNTTDGGEYAEIGTPIKVFNMQGVFESEWKSMIDYAEHNGLDDNAVASISHVCLRKRNYAYNKIFRYIDDTVTEDDLKRLNNSLGVRDSKKVYIMSLQGEILGEFDSIQKAVDAGFGLRSGISEALSGKRACVHGNIACNHPSEFEERLTKYIQSNSKGSLKGKFSQYDLSGNLINTFITMKDAVNSSGATNKGIKQCLDDLYGQAGGFQWEYGTEEKIKPYNKTYNSENRYKPINQYDLQGNLIKRWNSAKEAAEQNNGWSMTYIRSTAHEEGIAYGYIWKYT